MIDPTQEDMVVIRMGIDVLLECVQQSEEWWRVSNHTAALKGTQMLADAIRITRRRFFPDDAKPGEIIEALIEANGLREAARQCSEAQAALCARLTGGAEVIEQLCRSRAVLSKQALLASAGEF